MKTDADEIIDKIRNKPVRMTRKAWLKCKYFVEGINQEIYWWFLSEQKGVITDCILLNQEVSGAECELKEDAVAKWMEENLALMGKVVGWGHSHNNMGLFFSSTDEENIQGFTNSKSWISIVFHKPFDYLARVDIPTEFGKLPVEGLRIQLFEEEDDALKAECEALIKEKVVVKTYAKNDDWKTNWFYNKAKYCNYDKEDDKWEKASYLQDWIPNWG